MGDEVLRGGRYRIVGKLGEGAQGTTFDAVDGQTGRAVAIKRFSVRGAKSWKDVELAEREAAVLETLSHPALPAHVEHFEEDGALYLVMEKIEGQSLATLTSKGGALSRDDVLRFLRDASSVLAYLHGRSPPVFHRDINPKNVIRRPDGSFALVDFGAVRDRLKPEGGSTVVGTFGYMAPEQLQGRAMPATDVYSVGATALRLLTGREPETLPHRGLGIDVAQAMGAGADPALREALSRMLDPDPDRRASSLVPLLARLDRQSGGARDRDGARARDRDAHDRDARDHDRRSEAARAREEARQRSRDRRSGAPGFPGTLFEEGYPWEDEVRRWAEDARDRAREERRRAKQEREELRERYRQGRSERRETRDRWRAGRRARWRRRPVNGPPLLFALIGLNVAMLVVGIVVGVVVPTLLFALSLFLGRPLRNAAQSTRDAAAQARASMRRARSFLLHGPEMVEEPGVDATHAEDPSDRVRVAPAEEARPRIRVTAEEPVDTTAEVLEPSESERAHRR